MWGGMVVRAGVVALGLMVCLPGVAGAASLQDEFNAAQAAIEQRDFAKAAAGFEAVLAKLPKTDPKDHTLAQIRSRLGSARLALLDYEGAAEALELALPGLTGAANTEERRTTLYELSRAHEALLDYTAARRILAALVSEAEAEKAADADTLALYRVALARVSLFDEPDLARRQLDLALPVVEAGLDKKSNILAEVYTLRGRADLMAGKHKEAFGWHTKALEAAGGLGRKVTLTDLRIRGDLALVSKLLGNDHNVRRYLAYTGAGRMGDANPLKGADMPLPACGAATGLDPNDAAVVEFAIGDDGRVVFAQPIYATRTGPVALEFARAVTGWSWVPEELTEKSKFWRSSVRLELRCTKEVERANALSGLQSAFDDWLVARQIPAAVIEAAEGSSAAQATALWRKALAEREATVGKDDLSLLPLLVHLGISPAVLDKEAKELLTRAEAIAVAFDAPVLVRTLVKGLNIRRSNGLWGRKWWAVKRDGFAQLLAELEAGNAAAGPAGAWVRTELAIAHEALGNHKDARQLYHAVIGMPQSDLSQSDPVRQLAVVRLASLEAGDKKFDEADKLLQSAGLNPEQCELVDVKPVARRAHIASTSFPQEAINWGFEGWVKVSYDIDTEGKVVEPRTVIAYPPFVFGPATVDAVKKFEYQPIYRAGNSIGCTGYEQGVNYSIAGR